MLIKSECQPLDETRHKPAWNLFEQRESCKMAREICSAPRPPHRPVTVTFVQHVRRDGGRQTDGEGERRGGSHRGPASFWQNSTQKGVMVGAALPFRSHRWSTAPIKSPRQSPRRVRTCRNRRPLELWRTKPRWADSLHERDGAKEWFGLVRLRRDTMGGVPETETVQAGCYLTDECLLFPSKSNTISQPSAKIWQHTVGNDTHLLRFLTFALLPKDCLYAPNLIYSLLN